jgi:hypothetical protein
MVDHTMFNRVGITTFALQVNCINPDGTLADQAAVDNAPDIDM